MLFSTTLLRKGLEQRAPPQNDVEPFTQELGQGARTGLQTVFLVVAVFLLILELLLLFVMLGAVLKCTYTTQERVIHIVLLVTFTLPYTLFMILFNPCIKKSIKE